MPANPDSRSTPTRRLQAGPIAAALCLLGSLATAYQASGQVVAIDTDEVRIEDGAGNIDTRLGSGHLVLGRASNTLGVFTGGILEIVDFFDNLSFQVYADADYAHFTGTWHMRNAVGLTTVTLFGDLGLVDIGTTGTAGGLTVRDSAQNQTITLDGATGTATNAPTGNGFVKGWARIAADGTVLGCYNCDTDPMKTLKTGPGLYFVDFSPIDDDISLRPALATGNGSIQTTISTAPDAGDTSRVQVSTSANADFTVMIF